MTKAEEYAMDRLMWKPGEVSVSQCLHCMHSKAGALCAAFPNGIPDAILLNKHDHKKPYPGDHNIQFEARQS